MVNKPVIIVLAPIPLRTQALEGIALGTVVNNASFGRVKSLLMAATYSLTCPVGIAIGIGVVNSIGNSSSWEANIVQVRQTL